MCFLNQVELLNTALKQNTVICLNNNTSKAFVTLMMVREMRQGLWKNIQNGGFRALILASDCMKFCLLIF